MCNCTKTTTTTFYCCAEAELEALRSATDEAIQLLNSEIISAQSIGASDATEAVQLATERLRAARAA